MKTGPLKIYIDRLKDDDTEQIFEVLDPEILDLQDEELFFEDKVTVSGQAYLAKNHLILEGKIKALVKIPCSICNESIAIQIDIEDFNHTIEICEVPASIYDYADEIRSAILLKVPQFIECHEGNCPSRKDVSNFFKREECFTPFAELNSKHQ